MSSATGTGDAKTAEVSTVAGPYSADGEQSEKGSVHLQNNPDVPDTNVQRTLPDAVRQQAITHGHFPGSQIRVSSRIVEHFPVRWKTIRQVENHHQLACSYLSQRYSTQLMAAFIFRMICKR
jgi:hypothetical protein